MQEQIKKKKKKSLGLVISENLSYDEQLSTIFEIRKRVFRIFKFHKGIENCISPRDLFVEVFNVEPENIDVYKREYWYNVLKKVIKLMRKNEEAFIIFNHSKIFLLSSMDEMRKFSNMLDKDIINLQNLKEKGYKWINEKRYIDF